MARRASGVRRRVASGLRAAGRAVAAGLRWLRPPRRLRPTRFGAAVLATTLLVGLAAVNTGNNLLYLLLGAMLGFIAVSGWLSEQVLRGLRVRREVPRGIVAGGAGRIGYRVTNDKSRLPTLAVDVGELRTGIRGFLPRLPPGETRSVRVPAPFARRGVYELEGVTLSTAFPFGLFRKSRDLREPGELVVWPRTDRPVREIRLSGGPGRRTGAASGGPGSGRGEYRTLRTYRPGDDPRDVHWPSTARLGEPVVRVYDRDEARATWICLDRATDPGERAEAAVEVAAALAARAHRRGEPFGFVTQGRSVDAGRGTAHLEGVLDALARVTFAPGADAVIPPVAYEECVLVAPDAPAGSPFGDALAPGDDVPRGGR